MKARRRLHFKRIGLEAGPLSQWLYSVLAEAGLPVICVETRHMRAVLKAQINKTDRNDARGIAQMMRVGLYRPVHVKTLRSQKLRMLLTHRKLLQSKAIAIENDLRASLRNFGLKVGIIGTVKFEAWIRELAFCSASGLSFLVGLLMVAVIALVQRGMALRRWRHTIGTVRELLFGPFLQCDQPPRRTIILGRTLFSDGSSCRDPCWLLGLVSCRAACTDHRS